VTTSGVPATPALVDGAELVARARAHGLRLRLTVSGRIQISGRPAPDLRLELREHQAAVIAHLRRELDAELERLAGGNRRPVPARRVCRGARGREVQTASYLHLTWAKPFGPQRRSPANAFPALPQTSVPAIALWSAKSFWDLTVFTLRTRSNVYPTTSARP
jgi:hypothetical protein